MSLLWLSLAWPKPAILRHAFALSLLMVDEPPPPPPPRKSDIQTYLNFEIYVLCIPKELSLQPMP